MSRPEARAVRIASWLVGRTMPAGRAREALLGDLAEGHGKLRALRGRLRADAWCLREAIAVALPYGRERLANLGDARSDAGGALHHALRIAWRYPGHSAAVALTLAIGVAAVATLQTTIDAVLWRSIPGPNGEDIVGIRTHDPDAVSAWRASRPEFDDWRRQTSTLDLVSASAVFRATVLGRDQTLGVVAEAVTTHMFELFDATPAAGRLFLPDEYIPGAAGEGLAIVSARIWTQVLDSAPLPQFLDTDLGTLTVVGVMAPGFTGHLPMTCFACSPVEVWVPLANAPQPELARNNDRGARTLAVVARRRSETTTELAQLEFDAIAARLAADYPQTNRRVEIRVEPLAERWRAALRPGLRLLYAGAIVLLAIACVNAALLIRARHRLRAPELATRTALGATRSRLVVQLALENGVVASAGATLGLIASLPLTRWALRVTASRLPDFIEAPVDVRALVLAVATGAAVTLVAALGPALRSRDPFAVLRRHRDPNAGGRTGATIALQVGMTTVLLVLSMLTLRSLASLRSADLGFVQADVQIAEINLSQGEYGTDGARRGFAEQLAGALDQALPGVEYTLVAPNLPPRTFLTRRLAVDAGAAATGRTILATEHRIDTNFFEFMGMTVDRGRALLATDDATAAPVCLISESLARALAIDKASLPLALWLETSAGGESVTVVGVAADVRYQGPRPNRAADFDLYVPIAQRPAGYVSVAIRSGSTDDMAAVATAVRSTDPGVPLVATSAWRERFEREFAQDRMRAVLLGGFALAAFGLATLGVYAVTAFNVRARVRETAIRRAVGATDRRLLFTSAAHVLRAVAVGAAGGSVGAVLLGRIYAGMLYGIEPLDAPSLAVSSVVVGGAVLLATYLPTRAMLRSDPSAVLRS